MDTTTYTIEQFEIDFENSIDSKKKDVLDKAVELLDSDDSDISEVLQKYRDELKDSQDDFKVSCDRECNDYINTGIAVLHTCIKSYGSKLEGQNYYVRTVDLASEYREKGLSDVSEDMAKYVDSIKPLVWVISDDGVGTLKNMELLTGEFSEYFTEW